MTTDEPGGGCSRELQVLTDRNRAPQERLGALRTIADLNCADDATEKALNAVVSDESEPVELLALAGKLLGRVVFMRDEDPNFGARSLSATAFDPYFAGYFDAKQKAGG